MTNTADKPLVSIVTQVLNGNKYLENCIQSVLNQSYPYIEHIFVDGGSTDGTLDILASYRTRYPDRLRFISGPDKNASDAWNKGAKIVKGEILGWIGSDDIYEPDAIQTVIKFFQANPDAYFVFGGCNYINERGEVIKKIITRDFDLREAINEACYIPCSSAFYKRAVIEKVGYRDDGELNSEVEYWIRIGEMFKIHRIENVLSNFRQHKDKCEFNKRRYNKDFYNFSHTAFVIGRRYGAGIFSPCARRYYLALVTRPLQPVIDPIFHFMTTGDSDRSNFLVKVTRPLHPVMASIYHFMVGSKPPEKKRKEN